MTGVDEQSDPTPSEPSALGKPSAAGETSVAGETSESGELSARTTRSSRSWIRHPLLGALLLFIVVCAVVSPVIGLQIHRHQRLSVYDELSYFDSVYKAQHGHYIIGQGERLAPASGQVAACRGIQNGPAKNPGQCANPNPPRPPLYNTADIDPPTFTFLTTAGARVILKLDVTKNLLTAARLVNIGWAGLGLTLLMLFCRRLGASWPATVLAAGLLFFHPLAQTQWVYITPHALEVSVAVGTAWVAMNWAQGRGHWWALALAGFIPAWIKATDILGVAVAVLLLLTVAVLHRRRAEAISQAQPEPASPTDATADQREVRPGWRRSLVGAGILIAGLLVGTLSFLVVRRHYSLIPGTAPSSAHVDHFHFSMLSSSFADFLRPVFPIAQLAGLGAVFGLLIFGWAAAAMVNRSEPAAIRGFGTAVIGVGLFGSWLFVLSNYVVLSQYVFLPARYGLTLFPLAIACTARRSSGRVMLLAVGLLVLALIHLTFFPAVWGIVNAVP